MCHAILSSITREMWHQLHCQDPGILLKLMTRRKHISEGTKRPMPILCGKKESFHHLYDLLLKRLASNNFLYNIRKVKMFSQHALSGANIFKYCKTTHGLLSNVMKMLCNSFMPAWQHYLVYNYILSKSPEVIYYILLNRNQNLFFFFYSQYQLHLRLNILHWLTIVLYMFMWVRAKFL